jgi:hypothetical protein
LGHITTVTISKSRQLDQRCTVAACLHILRAMMAHVSGVSITCGHALKSREPSHIGRSAKHFFILKVCGPQRAVEHVAASEPSQVGKRGPVPWDTWQHWSPPEQGGRIQSRETHGSPRAWPEQGGWIQSHGIRGSVRALPSREVGSRAVGYVAAPEPS